MWAAGWDNSLSCAPSAHDSGTRGCEVMFAQVPLLVLIFYLPHITPILPQDLSHVGWR